MSEKPEIKKASFFGNYLRYRGDEIEAVIEIMDHAGISMFGPSFGLSVEEFVKKVEEATEGLTEARLEVITGRRHRAIAVKGWRPMREVELDFLRKEEERFLELKRQSAEFGRKGRKEGLTRLAKEYPEEFEKILREKGITDA